MKTIAVFAGSFNPFHKGHLNIVQKAEDIFGKGNVNYRDWETVSSHDVSQSRSFPVTIPSLLCVDGC